MAGAHFMAYQAIIDMRYTKLLNAASDLETWAAAGPGTIRGLSRLHGRPVDARLTQQQALKELLVVYQIVKNETDIRIDFNDVTGLLCETDKYLRVKLGEGKPRAL